MTESEKICLASADGHVGAPIEVYKDFLEKRLHPAFDAYYANHFSRWSPQSDSSFFTREWHTKMLDTEGFIPDRGTPVVWDPALRLKAMDQEMVACEVLIPDDQNVNDPPFGSGLVNGQTDGAQGSLSYPAEMVQAGARSYNRWLADFCSADPNRLRGATILGSLEHVIWCVDEVERAYESGLQTAIMLPLHSDLPLYHHPRYDILWDVCSELNLPVIVHIGLGAPKYLGEDPAVQRFMLGQEVFHHCQRALWTFIMGGVLERYPNLRVIPTEIGVDWVAPLLKSLDSAAEGFAVGQFSRDVERRVDFSMKPSEYWQRQCFVTHSHSQRRYQFEGDAYESVPNMIFGTDTGHAEGWWPVYGFPEPAPDFSNAPMFQLPVIPCEEAYEQLWGGLPASKMLPYLQDNFFRAYSNVDRAALDDVVERIGPTPAEIGLV
jgi:predicted TIM-barrel fold metal-dependent hydrolase